MERIPTLSAPGRGRKRIRDESNWQKTKKKIERHRPKNPPEKPQCKHSKTFSCLTLSMQDIRKFHQAFYDNKSKAEQDNFILKHTSQCAPKRHRPSKGRKTNTVSVFYFIKTNKGMEKICSKAFLTILQISRFRVQNISKHYLKEGTQPEERRGGDKRSKVYATHREKVIDFILKLKCIESHYTRNKSERQYMSSDCSIRKHWTLYCHDNEEFKVKYDYFRTIFDTYFNISFKSPATDACSECISHKVQIRSTKSEEAKLELITKLRVHNLKAKAFYEKIKSPEDDVIKLSFDCQKNLVLPRVPDQSAYYSRQLYFYNFTVCQGHSKAPQTKDSVTAFTWTENMRHKGSNEISSMLYHKLSSLDLEDSKKSIQLFCDGCPGQNKNVTMIGMLMKWLFSSGSSVKEVSIIFPVVGHSFLPPDRVFGRIEKVIKTKDTIALPNEYTAIISNYATVLELGKDYQTYNWKEPVQSVIKHPGQWHFKFSSVKRIILRKQYKQRVPTVVVKGEMNYRNDLGVFKTVVRKGKSLENIIPEPLGNKVPVKKEKLSDVDALLKKHYGPDWRNGAEDDLSFYERVLNTITDDDNNSEANVAPDELNITEDDDLQI